MSKIIRTLSISLLFIMLIFSTVNASSQVNMNLAGNTSASANVVASNGTSSTQSALTNSPTTNTSSVKASSSTNTAAVIKSVNELDDTSAGFGASEILNILLIAVGFVIILLAVAILIRLKK